MGGNSRQTYRLAVVERALAEAHASDIDEKTRKGAWKAALKYLNRKGLPGGKGQGHFTDYTLGDIHKLLIALELMGASIEPALAIEMVETSWGMLSHLIDMHYRCGPNRRYHPGEPQYGDVYLLVRLDFLIARWKPKKAAKGFFGPASFSYFVGRDTERFFEWLRDGNQRVLIVNLSSKLKTLDAWLTMLIEER
jgi:hypothetical protein